MRAKRFIAGTVFFLGTLAVGVAVGLVLGRFDLSPPQIAVREPAAPGEARLSYTPPAPPSMPIDAVAGNPMLLSMLRPKITEVSPGIYLATGYALGNVGAVVTPDGLVIIDATESADAAAEVLIALREKTSAPIRYLIYTHSHLDHIMGSSAFRSEGLQVVASSQFPDYASFQHERLRDFQRRARSYQAGNADPQHAFPLPVERSPLRGLGDFTRVLQPTVLVDEPMTITLGGVKLELFRTAGETPDHLAIWLPGPKVLFTGDLFYNSFPNLSSPMLEARPVRGWYESLARFQALQPAVLAPGHTRAVQGVDAVAGALRDYHDGVKFVHDEALRYVNEGRSVEEAVADIKLPEALGSSPWLQERYGRVAWSVRGIFQGYQGWYDGRGSTLNPLPARFRARELVTLSGGVDKVLARAIDLQKQGEHQLAAELCDVVIAANPAEPLAHRVKAASMQHLAYSANNLNNFGFFRSAYSVETASAP